MTIFSIIKNDVSSFGLKVFVPKVASFVDMNFPADAALFFSQKLDVPADQIKLVLSVLVSIPFGYCFRYINSPFLRSAIGLIFGLMLQYYVYLEGIFYCLLQTGISYVLIVIFKRKCSLLVFMESMVYLAVHHIYRQIFDYGSWKMDISVVLMIMTCKFTSFAFDYSDGGKENNKLSLDQQERKIVALPSFFEYCSFIYFFAGCVAGPTFGFAEYNDFIHKRKQYKDIPLGLAESFKNLLVSFGFLSIALFLMPIFPMQYIGTPRFFANSYFYQSCFLIISLTIIRCRYYGAWAMCQSTMSACGLSFAGYDDVLGNREEKWDKVLTADPTLELYPSPKDKQDKWNSSVQVWLKRYVFFRVYSEEQQKNNHSKMLLAQYTTYITSAIWHGFYPGYYIFFIHLGLITQLSKNFYKLAMKYPDVPIYNSYFYKFIRFIVPLWTMSFFGVAFPFLEFWKTVDFFGNFYFIPNFVLYGLFLFFNISGVDRVKSRKPQSKTE